MTNAQVLNLAKQKFVPGQVDEDDDHPWLVIEFEIDGAARTCALSANSSKEKANAGCREPKESLGEWWDRAGLLLVHRHVHRCLLKKCGQLNMTRHKHGTYRVIEIRNFDDFLDSTGESCDQNDSSFLQLFLNAWNHFQPIDFKPTSFRKTRRHENGN